LIEKDEFEKLFTEIIYERLTRSYTSDCSI